MSEIKRNQILYGKDVDKVIPSIDMVTDLLKEKQNVQYSHNLYLAPNQKLVFSTEDWYDPFPFEIPKLIEFRTNVFVKDDSFPTLSKNDVIKMNLRFKTSEDEVYVNVELNRNATLIGSTTLKIIKSDTYNNIEIDFVLDKDYMVGIGDRISIRIGPKDLGITSDLWLLTGNLDATCGVKFPIKKYIESVNFDDDSKVLTIKDVTNNAVSVDLSSLQDEEEEINDLSGLLLDFGKMTPNTKADIRTKTHSKFFICAKADGKIFIGYNAFFNIEDVGYVFNSNSKNSWISKSNITHFNGILYLYNRGQVIGDYDKTTGYVTFSDEFIEYFDIRPSTYFMFYLKYGGNSYNVTHYPNEDNILSMSAATVLQHELKDCKFKVQGKSMDGNIVYQARDDQYVLIEIVTRVQNNTRVDIYLASDTNRKIGYVTIKDMLYTSIASDYNNYNLITFTLELEPLKLLNTNLIKTDGTTIIDLYDNPKHKQIYDKIIAAYPECKIDRWRCRTPLAYSDESIVFKYDFKHYSSVLIHTIEFKIKDDMKTCNVLVRMNNNITEGYVVPKGNIIGLPFNPNILSQGADGTKLLNASINNVTTTDKAEVGEQNGKYTLTMFKGWTQIQTAVYVDGNENYNMYLSMNFENNTIPVEVKFDMTPIDPTLLFFENIVPMYKYLQLEQVATSGGRIGGGIIDETVVTSTTNYLQIINLTNEEYQELLKNNTIDPDTIYHTTDDTEVSVPDGFQYSLEEKYTGNRWIDGKKIYRKTFYIENISVKKVIDNLPINSFLVNTTCIGNFLGKQWIHVTMPTRNEGVVWITLNHQTGVVESGSATYFTGNSAYLTMEYTRGDE